MEHIDHDALLHQRLGHISYSSQKICQNLDMLLDCLKLRQSAKFVKIALSKDNIECIFFESRK